MGLTPLTSAIFVIVIIIIIVIISGAQQALFPFPMTTMLGQLVLVGWFLVVGLFWCGRARPASLYCPAVYGPTQGRDLQL